MPSNNHLDRADIFRMPTVFGPAIGPRQAPEGMAYDSSRSPERYCAFVCFKTDKQVLQKILPPDFQLCASAEVYLEFSYLSKIDWLAGRGYNMLTVRIPVRYQTAGKEIQGYFQPVVWENLTEPIISGREELGWSKIYAQLPAPEITEQTATYRALWDGYEFMQLRLTNITPSSTPPPSTTPILHHKYIPATESWGSADVSYITMTPAGGGNNRLLKLSTAQATLEIARPTWEQMPTQYKIINSLADLPIKEYVHAGVYTAVGGKNMLDQKKMS